MGPRYPRERPRWQVFPAIVPQPPRLTGHEPSGPVRRRPRAHGRPAPLAGAHPPRRAVRAGADEGRRGPGSRAAPGRPGRRPRRRAAPRRPPSGRLGGRRPARRGAATTSRTRRWRPLARTCSRRLPRTCSRCAAASSPEMCRDDEAYLVHAAPLRHRVDGQAEGRAGISPELAMPSAASTSGSSAWAQAGVAGRRGVEPVGGEEPLGVGVEQLAELLAEHDRSTAVLERRDPLRRRELARHASGVLAQRHREGLDRAEVRARADDDLAAGGAQPLDRVAEQAHRVLRAHVVRDVVGARP